MVPLAMLAIGSLLAAAPAGTAAAEIDLLEAYLSLSDAAEGTPHCARHSGYVLVPQRGPVQAAPATNALLAEHMEFHIEHGGPEHVPSPEDEDTFGETFLRWHEEFIDGFQTWRAAHGHPPLEGWDPSTPMPSSLAYSFPGRGCTPDRDEDPQVALPAWATLAGGTEQDPIFGHTRLCDFQDRNQFGKSISVTWHIALHRDLGGDMRAQQGPRDPAFWAAHQFLIDVTRGFEEACLGGGDASATTVEPEARVPAAPLVGALALAAAALVARRR